MNKYNISFPEFAIVTGASRGIGRSVSEALAQKGTHLLLNAREETRLAETCLEMEEKYPGVKILGFAADLSDRENALELGRLAKSNMHRIDLVVNNAGAFLPGSLEDEPDGRLQELLDANLFTAYNLSRAVIGEMKSQGGGQIVNICSVAGMQAYSGGGSYGIAKFALSGFSKNLREELKEFGIKVTTVYPGATLTDSWKGVDLPPERFMSSEDVAGVIIDLVGLSQRTIVEEIVLRPLLGDI